MNALGSSAVLVEPMTDAHADAVLAIYQSGLDEGNATFETQLPAWDAFSAARLPDHRLVATERNLVVGWVAAAAVSHRRVYAGVVEHSVYVDPRARGRGVGRKLLDALIASTEAPGIWTIQSGIFLENAASLRPHRSAGFRRIGARERIAQHHGRVMSSSSSGEAPLYEEYRGAPPRPGDSRRIRHLELRPYPRRILAVASLAG